ncbi:MAG TPA: DeoR/GlpR family DNA-binding transcription regulator [Candidatus Corynebacterium avicola]|uniref:Lactose phosphotransferase system repressor n=1 Tax=Candidatus Corynebacterium avicola TaxID=2838527 RepID=A0A9D1UM74_9CORY|nr:DeoR/GlpR family DNA-binding transcription regulator [Candidatus Corynebacterium avicola]
MYSEERRRQIASLTAVNGRVTVAELAERFNVTPETIRRDLTVLDNDGALHRVHGGAVPTNTYQTTETPIELRGSTSTEAKIRIGRAAAALLPRTGTVFLDAGTTTAMLAHAVAEAGTPEDNPYRDLTVLTNFLPLAVRLSAAGLDDVQLIGGHIRPITQAVVGDIALRTIGVHHADVAFIGTNALSMDHGLSTADAAEAAMKRAMIANASQVVAMCDSTKFGRDYLVSFATVPEIDILVTDGDTPAQYREALVAEGVEVVQA